MIIFSSTCDSFLVRSIGKSVVNIQQMCYVPLYINRNKTFSWCKLASSQFFGVVRYREKCQTTMSKNDERVSSLAVSENHSDPYPHTTVLSSNRRRKTVAVSRNAPIVFFAYHHEDILYRLVNVFRMFFDFADYVSFARLLTS